MDKYRIQFYDCLMLTLDKVITPAQPQVATSDAAGRLTDTDACIDVEYHR